MTATDRRTKRRYAHELYPHPEDGEPRALAVDVRHALAMAIGSQVGREWHDLMSEGGESARIASDRTMYHLALVEVAFLAVALADGLSGQAAWDWANSARGDEVDKLLYDAAARFDVDWDAIKPYLIRSEPDTHEHWTPRNARGVKTLLEYRVPGKESDCEACTEPVPASETEGDRG